MAERGAHPKVPRGRRLFLRAVRRLFSPLEPDDYLEMINPLWTTKELRGEIEGVFTLPEPLPAKMLFISAGSGITPIMSMLRSLDHRGELGDVVHIHSARTREQVMFLPVLEDIARRHDQMRLDIRLTGDR